MRSLASLQLSKVVQKFNGTFVVLAPNSVKRDTYNFQEHRADIISALNDYAAAMTDLGLQQDFINIPAPASSRGMRSTP